MSKHPWMPWYVGDYLADTGHLDTLTHGAYLLLLAHYWVNGYLPPDDASLKNITKTSAHNWKKIKPVLQKFFSSEWKHARVEEELEKADAVSKSRRDAGRKRWKNQPAIAPANGQQLPPQSQSQSQTPKKEKKDGRSLRELDALFEKFWVCFPNKVGKADAKKKFHAVINRGVDPAAVDAGVSRYVASKPIDRPWCNPATFLNQERWTDEPANVTTRPSNTITPAKGNSSADALVRGFAEAAAIRATGGLFEPDDSEGALADPGGKISH